MSTTTSVNHATTVAKMYDAFSRGDIPFIVSNIAEDCKWVAAGEGSLPQGGTYIGHDVVTFFKRLGENEEFNSFSPISINNINDDEVVAFGEMTATSRATGKKVSCDWVMHWRFDDEGKVIYFHDFFDTAAAYVANQMEAASSAEKEQNLLVVKNAFQDFLKGNITGILDICTDDVQWSGYENPGVPYGKTYRGKKGVGEFFSTLANSIDYSEFQPKEYFAEGEKIFVKGSHEAKVRSTGKSFSHDFLLEFDMRGRKISSFFSWIDTRDQALAFQS